MATRLVSSRYKLNKNEQEKKKTFFFEIMIIFRWFINKVNPKKILELTQIKENKNVINPKKNVFCPLLLV